MASHFPLQISDLHSFLTGPQDPLSSKHSTLNINPEAFKPQSSSLNKSEWLAEEKSKLRHLALAQKYWKTVAKVLNLMFHRGIQNRTANSCKRKWIHDLQNPADQVWTEEEDEILMAKEKEFGRKWQRISKTFYDKTAAQVKKRFNCLKRKKVKENKTSFVSAKLNTLWVDREENAFGDFSPSKSFRVQGLAEIPLYGFVLIDTILDPNVQMSNMLLDEFV